MAADKIFALRLSEKDFERLDKLCSKNKLVTKTRIARAALRLGMSVIEERGMEAIDEAAAEPLPPKTRTRRKRRPKPSKA